MQVPIALTARKASAATSPQPDGTCGLCVLAPSGDALDVTGDAKLAVYGSNVMVDSTDNDGITVSGKASLSAPSVGVVGGAKASGKSAVSNLTTGAAPASDPMAGSTKPAVAVPRRPVSVDLDGKDQRAIFPGVYKDISVSGYASLTLNPGTYVVLHQFSASGNGSVAGTGVSLYLPCSDYPEPCSNRGQEGGELDLSGNGHFDLTAAQGPCSSLLVQADPKNTGEIQVTGRSSDRLNGSVYSPAGSLRVTGAGSFSIGGQVVVHQAFITGKGTTSISGAAPLVSHPSLSLSPSSSGPYQIGSQQALTATLHDGTGRPIANEAVTLQVGGANQASPMGLTNDSGQVKLAYSGLRRGTDNAQALFGNGDTCVRSNSASMTWTSHPAPIAMGPVTGNFYGAPASAHVFAATPAMTPLFGQAFPVVDFNPPTGAVPGNSSGVGPTTRPFTDVTTNVAGDYTGTIKARGNGIEAGLGQASTFDAVLHSSFVVSSAGSLSFSVIADDGFLLGVGNGAAAVTGPNHDAPASGVTPFSSYPLMASWDDLGTGSPVTYPVTIHFPSAGTYPYELDYLSRTSQLSLVLAVAAGGVQPPPLAVYTGYADTARPPGAGTFPFPWKGASGVNFVGSPGVDGKWDSGALRFDNTSEAPVTLDHVTVDIGSRHYDPGFANVMVPAHGVSVLAGTGGNFDTSDAASSAGSGTASAPLAWGANGAGQLGDGTTTDRPTPTAVAAGTMPGLVQIAAGGDYTVALASDGTVWGWGANDSGQLGNGTDTNSNVPVRVSMPTGVKFASISTAGDVGCCRGHTLAIDTTGKVWAWGSDAYGSNGTGSPSNVPEPVTAVPPGTYKAVAVFADQSYVLASDGTAYAFGDDGQGEVDVPPGVKFNAIAASWDYGVGIDTSGNAWGWGADYGYQLGTDGTGPGEVHMPPGVTFKSVSLGQRGDGSGFGLALTSSGQAYAWGYNGQGQLGDGTTSNSATPVPVSMPAGVSFTAVSAGADHSLALDSQGRVWAWGGDDNGQLGDGGSSNELTPKPISTPSGIVFGAIGAGGLHSVAAPAGPGCATNPAVPQIHVTVGGVTTTYADTAKVLTFGGEDGECGGTGGSGAFSGYPASFAAHTWASDFATTSWGTGPIGLAFDSSGNLFVADQADGDLYKFPSGGGDASQHRLSASPVATNPGALVFSKSGRLYVGRNPNSDTAEVDPATGAVLRVAASLPNQPCDVVTDPLSGDLFASECGGGPIYRVSGFEGPTPATVTTYANLNADGLAVAPDGTLYAAGSNAIYAVGGTDTPQPASVRQLADVPQDDGIGFLTPPPGQPVTRLVVNRNDGIITQVDLSTTPATVTDVVTGGTRGDFVTTGPDGCLYATQTATIEKVTASDGSCPFIPTGTGTSESHPWSQLNPQAPTVNVPMPPALTLALSPSTLPGATVGKVLAVSVSATDSAGQAVSGLDVTLAVSGPNAQQLTSPTDPSGIAGFSYMGSSAGTDTLTPSAFQSGLLEVGNSLPVTWTIPLPAPTPITTGQTAPSIFNLSPADQTVVDSPTPVSATILTSSGFTVATWRVTSQLLPNGNFITLGSGSGSPPATLATFDPSGLPAGTYALTVSATSTGGGSASAVTRVVIAGSGTGGGGGGSAGQAPPTISDLSPPDGTVVTSPVPVEANFTPPAGETVASWQAIYQAMDPEPPVVLASGSGTPPTPLANFDPTMLPNDTYTITVSATSSGGGTQSSTTTVAVSGALKLGRTVTSYQDLSVPIDGVQMQLLRTYDSTDKRVGDFGVGWHVGLANFRVSANRQLGSGPWSEYTTSCFILCSWAWKSAGPRYVTVTWPDGHQEIFDFTPTGPQQTLVDFDQGTAAFTPRPGTGTTSTLSVANPQEQGFTSSAGALYDSSGRVYNPTSFILTTTEGKVFYLDTALGLTSETNPNGTSLTVDASGVHASNGQSIAFTRDSQGRITSASGPAGQSLSYTYSQGGDLASSTDPGGHATTYSYDASHDLLHASGPAATGVYSLSYGADGRLDAVTDAAGHTTHIVDNLASLQQVTTDPSGQLTRVDSFDEKGDVTQDLQQAQSGAVLTRSWTYDAAGNLLSATDPLADTTTGTYDAVGDLTALADPMGNQWTYSYDSRADLLSETAPDGTVLQSATYNGDGQPALIHRADGESAAISYDANGQLTKIVDGAGNSTSFGYDALGHPNKEVDAGGGISNITSDPVGRVLSVTDPSGATTFYGYDPAGHITSIKDANGHTTTYGYDDAGRIVSITDPDGNTQSYRYTSTDQAQTATDRDGVVTTLGYDADGRLTRVSLSTGDTTAYSYDAFGRLIDSRNATADLSDTYDGADRLTSETTSGTGLVPSTMSYAYDADGHVTAVTGPTGTVRMSYDVRGLPTGEVDPSGKVLSLGWTAAGQLSNIVRPNGATDSMSYDSLGQATGQTTDEGSSVLLHQSYTYDAVGRRVSTTDAAGTTNYGFDTVGRLNSVTRAGATQSYGYDSVGNRIAQSGISATASYDPDNRLIDNGITHYTYDAEGRVVSKTVDATGTQTRYTWNGRGQLSGVLLPDGTTESFGYDPLGRRIVASTGAEKIQYVYDGPDLAATRGTAGAIASFYLGLRGSGVMLEESAAGPTTYPVVDPTRNVIATIDSSGAVSGRASYDPFGNLVSRSGTLDQNATYGGRPRDPSTGLIDDRERTYDPSTGRFLSQDPLPKTNSYAYAADDPVDYSDPSGAGFVDFAILVINNLGQATKPAGVDRCMGAALIAGLNEINGGDPSEVAKDLNGAIGKEAEILAGPAGPVVGLYNNITQGKGISISTASKVASLTKNVLRGASVPDRLLPPTDYALTDFSIESHESSYQNSAGEFGYSYTSSSSLEWEPVYSVGRVATFFGTIGSGLSVVDYFGKISGANGPQC